jgi:hypothetical protein
MSYRRPHEHIAYGSIPPLSPPCSLFVFFCYKNGPFVSSGLFHYVTTPFTTQKPCPHSLCRLWCRPRAVKRVKTAGALFGPRGAPGFAFGDLQTARAAFFVGHRKAPNPGPGLPGGRGGLPPEQHSGGRPPYETKSMTTLATYAAGAAWSAAVNRSHRRSASSVSGSSGPTRAANSAICPLAICRSRSMHSRSRVASISTLVLGSGITCHPYLYDYAQNS